MQLWGFERSKSRHDARYTLNQDAGSVNMSSGGGGGTGAAAGPHPEHDIREVPVQFDELPDRVEPSADFRPVRVTFVSATPQQYAQHAHLIAHPDQIRRDHPLFRQGRVRSYTMDIQDTDHSGRIGDNDAERRALVEAINGRDGRNRVPGYEVLHDVASNPTVTQRDRSNAVVSELFRMPDGQDAAVQAANDTLNPNDPALDILNRRDSREVDDRLRRIERELARILAELQAGVPIENVLPQMAAVLARQGNTIASKLASTAVKNIHAAKQNQLEASKRTSGLYRNHSTDAAAQSRNNAAMTDANTAQRLAQESAQEAMDSLKNALGSTESTREFAQYVSGWLQRNASRG